MNAPQTLKQMCSNLHWLGVWALSGDDPFFVHQHLSECAHFLSNLFFRVPEDAHEGTAVNTGAHALIHNLQLSTDKQVLQTAAAVC